MLFIIASVEEKGAADDINKLFAGIVVTAAHANEKTWAGINLRVSLTNDLCPNVKNSFCFSSNLVHRFEIGHQISVLYL